jgi:hypothetical protein
VPTTVVVSVEMGYGHLRAAVPLAEALGTVVLHADRPPLADEVEQRRWARTRASYEAMSRMSQVPFLGAPLRALLDAITAIPHLFPYRDMSGPTPAAHLVGLLTARGAVGRGLVAHLRRTGAALLTTFPSIAHAADRVDGAPIWCVITDTDVSRAWVPVEPRRSRIVYFAPTHRVSRRLRAYGVPGERIRLTGFPLPGKLLGGPGLAAARRNLAARLMRLDPEGGFRADSRPDVAALLGTLPEEERGRPPLLTYAVGGAGAQAELVRAFLPGFAPAVRSGRMRLALVAGVRTDVEATFREQLHEAGLEEAVGHGVEIVREPTLEAYFARTDELLARTDVLWTKPSEMVFYGALGLPLVLSQPVGVHERYNRRWVIERGAGLAQRDPRFAAERLAEWLSDGTMAAAAWSGFTHLPNLGLYRIIDAVRSLPA